MQPTKRQQDITTLLFGFEQYFPGVQLPEIKHVCAWLYRLPVDRIIAIMEKVAERDAVNPFNAPSGAIWKLVQHEAVSTADAVRFDAEGQRL